MTNPGEGQLIQFPLPGSQSRACIQSIEPVQRRALSHRRSSRPSTQDLIGRPLPVVSLQQVGGQVLGCEEIADRWVVYYFYCGADGDSHREVALHRAFLGARPLLAQLGVRVVGISSQSPSALLATIIASRIDHLMLRDPALQVAAALDLPTYLHSGQHCYQQVVLLAQANTIEWVLYPVRDQSAVARQLIAWMQLSGWPEPSDILA